MKPITQMSQKEVGSMDARMFVEAVLSDDKISKGEITLSMRGGFYNGELNLNILTDEVQRYASARLEYSNLKDRLEEALKEKEDYHTRLTESVAENMKLTARLNSEKI